MKKRVSVLLGVLSLCLLLAPLTATTAYADYDEIVNYDITVAPNVEDGSLLFTAEFDWKALEELPYGEELKIGIPNGSIREKTALTDNIERLSFDNSYMHVYLDRGYKAGETFHFAYSWVQEYMYTLDQDGGVTYDYTPGWFDEARIDHMTVTWQHPQGVEGSVKGKVGNTSLWTAAGDSFIGEGLPHGEKIGLIVTYPDWPTDLSWDNSSENLPDDDWGGGGGYDFDSGVSIGEMIRKVIIVLIVVWVIYRIVSAICRDGYSGGFGTHYVFYHNLWYPAGPDGKPKPGSVGTAHKPRPPVSHSSGGSIGGGRRGGGFGGGGSIGGGSHCACASSCACACACACAGGGRAGCSAKNLYGAIRLDEEMSRRLEDNHL